MLSVKNLTVSYGDNTVLHDLSFSHPGPGFMAICGHNGCGKSTLLKAIAGKLDYHDFIDVDRDQVAYLAQSNRVAFPISVKELLLMGRFRTKHFLRNYDREDERVARELLSRVNLQDGFERPFEHLSGGQQQLVWIVQTLLQDLNIYLFDEPTQHLDIKNKGVVFDFLAEIAREGKLILCVTHDLEYLADMEGYILNLSRPQPEPEPISGKAVRDNMHYLKTH